MDGAERQVAGCRSFQRRGSATQHCTHALRTSAQCARALPNRYARGKIREDDALLTISQREPAPASTFRTGSLCRRIMIIQYDSTVYSAIYPEQQAQ
eukprot:6211279-Pleurochrysis_carterae.AAC.7